MSVFFVMTMEHLPNKHIKLIHNASISIEYGSCRKKCIKKWHIWITELENKNTTKNKWKMFHSACLCFWGIFFCGNVSIWFRLRKNIIIIGIKLECFEKKMKSEGHFVPVGYWMFCMKISYDMRVILNRKWISNEIVQWRGK